MRFKIHNISTKGFYHNKNEDRLRTGKNFIVLADGMGGEKCGNIASEITVDTIYRILKRHLNFNSPSSVKEIMTRAIGEADKNIAEYVGLHPESLGMGSTVLLVAFNEDTAFICWCGDSRCSCYKDGKLFSLTSDHSYVQELIDSGKISVDDSYTHPENNVITRFVGGGMLLCKPDFTVHKLDDNEILILSSDGLTGYCREADISRTIDSSKSMSVLPRILRDLAIKCGSDDDITIATLYARCDKCTEIFKQILNRAIR